jgi:hypothetical protein
VTIPVTVLGLGVAPAVVAVQDILSNEYSIVTALVIPPLTAPSHPTTYVLGAVKVIPVIVVLEQNGVGVTVGVLVFVGEGAGNFPPPDLSEDDTVGVKVAVTVGVLVLVGVSVGVLVGVVLTPAALPEVLVGVIVGVIVWVLVGVGLPGIGAGAGDGLFCKSVRDIVLHATNDAAPPLATVDP